MPDRIKSADDTAALGYHAPMSLALIMPQRDSRDFERALRAALPGVDLQVFPRITDPDDVIVAVMWNQPSGVASSMPGLRAVISYGAGVERIIGDPTIPASLSVGRVVDPGLSQQMSAYLLAVILHHARDLGRYRRDQANRSWRPEQQPVRPAVGILGLGSIGSHAAGIFRSLGYPVLGWRRRAETIRGIDCYHGESGLEPVLAGSDYLICALPLTEKTRGILRRSTFERMRAGAYLINVGRGEQLVEADLLHAIEQGRLSGACLDVFAQEPLPPNHPFWHHERIRVTPHIAAITCPETAALQVAESYRRVLAGRCPLNPVDRILGY